jgi:Polyketide cyclase / dehydrase and lipid transport
VREQITTFEPERRLCYTLLSGAPVRDYRGTLMLESCGAGTKLTWTVQFEPKGTWLRS